MKLRIVLLDHIQIAAPEGSEAAAREFYGAFLGMQEIEKPEPLRCRGAAGSNVEASKCTLVSSQISALPRRRILHSPPTTSTNCGKLSSPVASKLPTTPPSPASAASTPKIPGATASSFWNLFLNFTQVEAVQTCPFSPQFVPKSRIRICREPRGIALTLIISARYPMPVDGNPLCTYS
jgi:hypothetical protein